jgi:hypothetical protein
VPTVELVVDAEAGRQDGGTAEKSRQHHGYLAHACLRPCKRATSLARSSLRNKPVAPKKEIIPRRVWRMTSDAPLGTFVDFDPAASPPHDASGDAPLKVLDPAPVTDWRASSFDLLNGVEVRDHTDTIPGELFNRLFKR